MSRRTTASRFAAALLATTCLTPIIAVAVSVPSWADGGQGDNGAAGGTDSVAGTGGTGTNSATGGGGGGGAGVTGGRGGDGSSGSGGNGGLSPGGGGDGGTGNGGGGGGAHGEVVSVPGAIGAAVGGDGGSSSSGGGGAGGYGAAVAGTGSFTASGAISGGSGGGGASGGSGGVGIAFSTSGSTLGNNGSISGGAGGQGPSNAGTGGAGITGSSLTINNSSGATVTGGVGGDGPESHGGGGGAGISSSSSTINNSGSIAGGAGGAGDVGGGSGGAGISGTGLTINNSSTASITGGIGGTEPESHGAGGAGISASSTTVINSGSIAGALNDVGRANAITFSGGTNVLELQAGSSITGNVAAFSAADTLRLGGSTNASFDASQIGSSAQYRNFGLFEKTGTGTWTLTGTSSQTTPWTITQGTLAVNGGITGDVTVATAGTLGGNGTITGTIVNNGTIAPGNSIGTLTFSGSYTQAAGSTYQVEVNSTGASDRINVTGAPGTAIINGGTVQVLAAGGTYGHTTTYTILNATGGVTGTFAGVSSNFAFLTPSLSYDADDAFLTLTLNGFTFNQLTPNQRAVGAVLDQAFASATGDFATILTTLTSLDTVQGPKALNALSGEPYADFGTMMAYGSSAFMNALGQQMATTHGAPAAGARQALAQACDAEACDVTGPWSAWVSAVGGLGSVQGDGNASTLTYNFGGAAAGLDYRFDPRFLAGVAAGYTAGNLWVDSFQGRGWSNGVAVAAYGSFTQAALYVDALAGYAHFDNRLQRQISFPGLQRTANGSTQANQAFGQVEAGYRLPVGIASASVTPFARLQLSTATQDGFSEGGASSIDLTVAAQTTTSARGVLGVDLANSFDIGNARTLDLDLRLGWSHEYADTGRPMTATFAGAPGNPFTVYGATPQRAAAAIGFRVQTKVSDRVQLYLRYDGEISSESDNHSLNAGVRLTW
ncbi:MAG TPA: autotransporter domain-containing protein [Reyranella sp.]